MEYSYQLYDDRVVTVIIPTGFEAIPSLHVSSKIGYKIHIQNTLTFLWKVFLAETQWRNISWESHVGLLQMLYHILSDSLFLTPKRCHLCNT